MAMGSFRPKGSDGPFKFHITPSHNTYGQPSLTAPSLLSPGQISSFSPLAQPLTPQPPPPPSTSSFSPITRPPLNSPPPPDVVRGLNPASPQGTLRFVSASAGRQHPAKTERGYIYADAVCEAPRLLGVCDGVSGVQKLGLPPDLLPKELLLRCSEVYGDKKYSDGVVDSDGHWLATLLHEAYDGTNSLGATTVLLAAIQDSHTLVVANVGDCGLLLLRPTPSGRSADFPSNRLATQYRTEPLRYDANRPMQVARLDDISPVDVHRVIEGANVDTVPCRHGDLIVMGTDGIFDNLADEDIVAIVGAHCDGAASAETGSFAREGFGEGQAPSAAQLESIADALVTAAIQRVRPLDDHERLAESFTMLTGGFGGERKPGGNADDTTCIVAAVVEVEDAKAYEDFFQSRAQANAGRTRNASRRRPHESEGMLAGLFPQCCHVDADPEEYEETTTTPRSRAQMADDVEEDRDGCSLS